MRVSDLAAVLGIAFVTAAITIAALLPRGVSAEGDADIIKPMISSPKLTIDGCEFTVSMDKQEYTPGESPVLTVVAKNVSLEPVATSATISVTAASLQSMMSRIPRMPATLWTKNCPVHLKPGESRSFTFPTEAALSSGQMVSVSMLGGEQTVIANLFDIQSTQNVAQ